MTMATDNKPDWYQKDVKSINPDAQHLLESYSGLQPDEVLSHVLSLRDEAFQVCQYPCIGQMRFLSFNLSRHPKYERVLEYLRTDPSAGFLDAGCCFGQEIRFLAHQGIPGRQLFGLDVEKKFIDLGYQLFRDKDRLGATFALGNITTDEDSETLAKSIGGKFDIVFAGSLFHLWDYETQLQAAKRLVRLFPDKVGVMIVGRQVGSLIPGEYSHPSIKIKMYYHNVESLKGMWDKIGQETNTRWEVEASLTIEDVIKQNKDKEWMDADKFRIIWWSATRLA